MLTGDKIDTAKCIAIATGMNTKSEEVHEIRGELRNFDTTAMNNTIIDYE
jgi:magnesium-transporting ATPase (P-type)